MPHKGPPSRPCEPFIHRASHGLVDKVRLATHPPRASECVPSRPGALRVSRDAPGAGSGAPRWLRPSRFSARPERRLTPPLPLRLPQGRFTPSRRAVVVDKQHSVVMLIPKKNRKEVYKYLFRGASPGDPRRAPRSAFLATVAHPAHPVSPRALTPPRVPSVAHRGCHLREEGLQPPRAPRDQGGAQPSGTRSAVPRVRRRRCDKTTSKP